MHANLVMFSQFSATYTVKPLYSGHPWDVANWLLYKGGLIIQCTFNREVLFGTLLGGCLREVTFLYRFAIQYSLDYPNLGYPDERFGNILMILIGNTYPRMRIKCPRGS